MRAVFIFLRGLGIAFRLHGKELLTTDLYRQYEARFCMIEVLDDIKEPSPFFHEMKGTKMPIAVSQYVFFLYTFRENNLTFNLIQC